MGLWQVLASIAAALAATVPSGPWAQTLDELDQRRNHAFVHGDPDGLSAVYAPQTPVLAADRRTLRAYRMRGLEIDRVRMHLLRVTVLSRRPGHVRLRVVDCLRPTRVREPAGHWRALPRDGPTRRRIVLVRTPQGWRIADATRLAG